MDHPSLTLRQRGDFLAHLWKALVQQHHAHLRPLLRPHIPRDGVVFDVGAHAGQFAKLFARMAPGGRVYAFEPGSYPRSILSRVVRYRRLSNIEIVPQGLSDRPGELELVTPIKDGWKVGFGLAHLGAETRFKRTWRETTPVTSADLFAAEHGLRRLDFIKVDIEGWEGRFMAGAADIIARFRPAMLIEIVDERLVQAGDSADGIFATLLPLGYRAFRQTPDRTAPLAPCTGYAGPADYLFVPPTRT